MLYVSSKLTRLTVVSSLMIALMTFTACGKGGSAKNPKIDGIDGPNVSFVSNKLMMTVVFKNVSLDAGTRFMIPKMPNSYIELGPDFQSTGFMLSIGLDAGDVVALAKGSVTSLDPTTLPGGRPLPGVINGYLPGIAVQVPKLNNVAFYVGAKVLGVFVPVKMPWKDYIATFRFFDQAGDQIGNISLVGADAQEKNSGILLLINLAGKVGRLIGV